MERYEGCAENVAALARRLRLRYGEASGPGGEMANQMDDSADDLATPDLDALFESWQRGETGAFDVLFTQLYDQLRILARKQGARSGASETLRPTAIVHEAYLRLADIPGASVQNREHFFSLAARAMRFVLVDAARRKTSEKRGGGAVVVAIDETSEVMSPEATADEILLVHQALERLTEVSQRQAQVFELRAFGGLSVEEVGNLTGVAAATVKRDWQKAKLFVARELSAKPPA